MHCVKRDPPCTDWTSVLCSVREVHVTNAGGGPGIDPICMTDS